MESSSKDRTLEETYIGDRDGKIGNVLRRFSSMFSRFRGKLSEETVVAEIPLNERIPGQILEAGGVDKVEIEEVKGGQVGFKGKHDPFNSTEDAKVYKTMTWLSVNPRSNTSTGCSDTLPQARRIWLFHFNETWTSSD
jgi:hypothetical protein